jgi:hypothetical protein
MGYYMALAPVARPHQAGFSSQTFSRRNHMQRL